MVGSQPAAAAPTPAATAPPPTPAAQAPKPAGAASSRSKQTRDLIGGLLVAGVLIALVIFVLLNGLVAVARVVQNLMVNGPGVVIGIIWILVIIGIVGTIVSFLLKPLRNK